MEEPEERGIPTRFISRKRFDLFRQLIERYTRKRLDEDGKLPALYVQATVEENHKRHAYLVHDAKGNGSISPPFRKRVIYRPIPEDEEK